MTGITRINYFKRLILSNICILVIVAAAFLLIYMKTNTFLREQSIELGLNGLIKSVTEFESSLYQYRLKGETLFSESTVVDLASRTVIEKKDYYTMHKIITLMTNYFLDDSFMRSDYTYFETPRITKAGMNFITSDDITRNWIYTVDGEKLGGYFEAHINDNPYSTLLPATIQDPSGVHESLLYLFQTEIGRHSAITAVELDSGKLSELFSFFPEDEDCGFFIASKENGVVYRIGNAEAVSDGYDASLTGSGYIDRDGTIELYYRTPLFNNLYVITVSHAYFNQRTAALGNTLIGIILLLMALCLSLSVWLSRMNARPVTRLMQRLSAPSAAKGNEFEIIYASMEAINTRNETLTRELQRNNVLLNDLFESSSITIHYPIENELCLINAVNASDQAKIAELIENTFDTSLQGLGKEQSFAACAQLASALRRTILRILAASPDVIPLSSVMPPDTFTHFENPERLRKRTIEVFVSLCMAAHPDKLRAEALYRRINEHIQERFSDGALSIASIADHFGLHENYVSRYYKEKSGMNLSAAIEQLRMAKAMELISQSDMPISRIAEEVGYLSNNSFYKAFKRIYRISPVQCRSING